MGWKTLSEAFGIEKHIVCVTSKGICIGSGYVHDLVTIDPTNGALHENPTFNGFITKNYPELAKATPDALLALIQADDTFTDSITVYTYQDGNIIEKLCENPGWPNATHDGELMYENSFSTDKAKVIGWAKRNAELRVTHTGEALTRTKDQLASIERDLECARAAVAKLEADYPGVPHTD